MSKKIGIACLVILLASTLFAQEKVNPNGHNIFYYPNGKISSEGNLKNGKPEGYWYNYYNTGILKSEGNRKNFLLDSSWIFYNPQGDVATIINYEKGLKHGVKKEYNDSCFLVKEEFFVDDTLHGEVKYYYGKKGNPLKETIPYEKGIREGIGYEYAEDDQRIVTVIKYTKGSIEYVEKINAKDYKGKKQGRWQDFYPNGRLKKEVAYKDDMLHGYTKEYDESGKLLNAYLYINGELQKDAEEVMILDVKKEYYNNGKVKREGTYNLLGKKQGTFKEYDTSGTIIGTEIYKNDLLIAKGLIDELGYKQGDWEYYYLSGKLKKKGSYKDDLEEGNWTFLFETGETEQKGSYSNGKKNGDWVWYYPSGNVLRKENFRKGKEDGFMFELTNEGDTIIRGDYIDGQRDGYWYYHMGDHTEKGEYRNDKRFGVWVFYHLNGKKSFEGKFIDGEPDGEHLYYYENGKVKWTENYTLGTKQGTWKKYDEYGMEVLSIVYKEGEEFKIDGTKIK
jgi:antitoxin component YwqK of YwqJK toxin-antitoxin module